MWPEWNRFGGAAVRPAAAVAVHGRDPPPILSGGLGRSTSSDAGRHPPRRCEKRPPVFFSFSVFGFEIDDLPSQARDKHKEKKTHETVFAIF